MANAIKELISRTNYEFFLARLQESKEIMGWIALSFHNEGCEEGNREIYDARLEWTQMCSHILSGWKVDGVGGNGNVWEILKRASADLQAVYLPRHYCVINTLVVLPEFQQSGVPNSLLLHAIDFWRKRVAVGKEWAVWVQAPPFTQNLYRRYGFEEVGGYEVELGDYGFCPRQEREVSGKYNWKFMVRREASGSAIGEPDGARGFDEEEGMVQGPEDVEEHVAMLKRGKGKDKERRIDNLQADEDVHPARGDSIEGDAEQTRALEEAEEKLKDTHFSRSPPPLPGEEACLTRVQSNAEARGHDITDLSKGKDVEQVLEDVRAAPAGEPSVRPLHRNDEGTGLPQHNYIPSGSEKDLIEAMRKGGVDEEEIELVISLAFSMSDEAREE